MNVTQYVQSYTNAADEIRPRLWLGNATAAHDKEFLKSRGITVVFNCTKSLDFVDLPSITHRYRVPVDDNLEPSEIENMAKWSPEIILHLLQEYKAGKSILVHCMAGMQRSAAVVAMFLLANEGQGLTVDKVITDIKGRRRIAFFPSANFYKSIQHFHHIYNTQILPYVITIGSPPPPKN